MNIYHNPRCSKSRAALKFVQEFCQQRQISLNVIDYLKTPLNLDELRSLQQQLGAQSQDMVREHTALTNEQQCEILLVQPELLQRPIVSYKGRAAIGRPMDHIYLLLQGY